MPVATTHCLTTKFCSLCSWHFRMPENNRAVGIWDTRGRGSGQWATGIVPVKLEVPWFTPYQQSLHQFPYRVAKLIDRVHQNPHIEFVVNISRFQSMKTMLKTPENDGWVKTIIKQLIDVTWGIKNLCEHIILVSTTSAKLSSAQIISYPPEHQL